MSNALAGRRVAVTRSEGQNDRLAKLLRGRGAQVLEVPLLQFARTRQLPALQRRLSSLSDVNWLLLTSPQAVSALFSELAELGQDGRALRGVKLAVVGEGTARHLRQRGLEADFVPSRAGASFLAAELPARAGERALHLSSQLTEGHLAAGLAERGIALEHLELYRTEPAILGAAEREALRAAQAVALASGSAAWHLAALGLSTLPAAVIGPQTAAAAKQAGFERVIEAQAVSLEGLAQATETLFQRLAGSSSSGSSEA